jgi:hypothetical protein
MELMFVLFDYILDLFIACTGIHRRPFLHPYCIVAFFGT